jgi:opacity protein-like surface antigen
VVDKRIYGWKLGRNLRLSAGLTLALPLGSGGGNSGDADMVTAHKAASLARSSMEGSLFGVNDFATGYSLDFAYVGHGLTAQVGTAVFTSFRARGDQVQSDTFKANWTSSLGLSYFIIPQLSVGAEGRYQRYLSTPSSVEKDPTTRQNLSAAGGLRGHFKVSDGVWLRPGASYGHGIVGPIEKNGYHLIQVDVPVSF